MKEKFNQFIHRILRVYKVVIYNEHLQEKLKFTLSPINLILFFSLVLVVTFFFSYLLFAYTPIKLAIPGVAETMHTDPGRIYQLELRADSLENLVKAQNKQMDVLKKILKGEALDSSTSYNFNGLKNEGIFKFTSLKNDSVMVEEKNLEKTFLLFSPAKGYITAKYEPASDHYAVDIITTRNAPVKAVADGMVIFSEWSSATGHVIIVQHINNLISVYKHNSVLLKKSGNFVRSGEVLALVGNSGELTTGPHLHFELWHKGSPVNPEDFITF
ncbi:MAG: M23 family metallopeptidase [Bacteroidetes bacterium]|nr:M23 family metallopeptidase [Bacteroidota bacterium]